jgi:hypothetical protein
MEAKRTALESIVAKKATGATKAGSSSTDTILKPVSNGVAPPENPLPGADSVN